MNTFAVNTIFSKRTITVLDGATGTELERRGFPLHAPLWSAAALRQAAGLLAEIHREYVLAGANVITANTFRTNPSVALAAGLTFGDARSLTMRAVDLARQACRNAPGGRQPLVAGSIAPVADCYTPGLVPGADQLDEEHGILAGWLAEAGCDLILIETMNTLSEALAAARAAGATGLPFAISLVTDTAGLRLLSGQMLEDAAVELAALHPAAILTNCSTVQASLNAAETLGRVRARISGDWAFGGYPNGGMPDPVLGYRSVKPVAVEGFVEGARQMIALGGRIIGGCCGTTPAWTRALRSAADTHTARPPVL